MSAAEESIVYFFAGAVEHGNVCVQILSCPVRLYGFYAAVKNTVDGRQEIGRGHVVGIHDDYNVECICINGIHGHCQCFGFRTFLVIRHQQADGKGCQSVVCFRSHLIGNDYDLIEFLRIILFKKALYGSNNHAVFLVGGKEHDDASERTGFGVLGSPVKLGGNSV